MSVALNATPEILEANGLDPTRLGDGGAGASLNIAMLSNLFAPVATGSSAQCLGLSRALTAAGHSAVVITAHLDKNTAQHEVIDGVHVYRVPALRLPAMAISLNFPWLNWTFWPANLRRIAEILKRHRIDLLHVHNHMFDMAFAAAVLRRRLHLPMVVTIHTIIKHSIEVFNRVLTPTDRILLKRCVIDRADAVICPDYNIQRYLEERFDRHDGQLIPYGIELPPDPGLQVHEAIRNKFGLHGKRIILSLGHVHALRNRLDLIQALPAVRERFPDVRLLVVGTVADQRPVALVKEHGLDDVVIFAGAQPYAHVPAYHHLAEIEAMWFDQADGGLNPLGIACMEAMYAGRPVLTVSNEDTFGPGVLRSGRDLMIIRARQPQEVAAILIDLLSDRDKAARMGAAAKELATQRFAWPNVATSTIDLYHSLLRDSAQTQDAAVRRSGA